MTTTTPAGASAAASSDPLPNAKAPPCSQTITGCFDAIPACDVHTLSDRQSSLIAPSGLTMDGSPPRAVTSRFMTSGSRSDCGHTGPSSRAERMPVHGIGGRGGVHRDAPTGGAAYGMPLKATTSLCDGSRAPSTIPASMVTRTGI